MSKKKSKDTPNTELAPAETCQLNIDVPVGDKANLDQLAKDENITVAALVRDLITAALIAAPMAHGDKLRVAEWIKFQVRLAVAPNRLIEGIPE